MGASMMSHYCGSDGHIWEVCGIDDDGVITGMVDMELWCVECGARCNATGMVE